MEDTTQRLDRINQELISKLERAIRELDSYILKESKKEKRVSYDEEGKKPLLEETLETEEIKTVKGIIDRSALKQLVSTYNELRGRDTNEDSQALAVYLSEECRELAQ